MSPNNQQVVFAVNNYIYHWDCQQRFPVFLAERPDEITAFAMRGDRLVDGCYDGKVRDTVTDEVLFEFPNSVLGVNSIFGGHKYFPETDNDKYLRARMAKKHGLDPNRMSPDPLAIATGGPSGQAFLYLDNQVIGELPGQKCGKFQTLSTYYDLFTTNDGYLHHLYFMTKQGNIKQQQVKRFPGGSVQLVLCGDSSYFYSLYFLNDPIGERRCMLEDRSGRVVFSFSWEDIGLPHFMGIVQRDEEYYLIGCFMAISSYRRPDKLFNCQVCIIPCKDLHRGEDCLQPLCDIYAGSPRYGRCNPFLASYHLAGLVQAKHLVC